MAALKAKTMETTTMTIDYNDGKWHGWNNDGPCPVHPKSMVQATYPDGDKWYGNTRVADSWGWRDDECPIVAFRVVKVYQEPLEVWVVMPRNFVSGSGFAACKDKSDAEFYLSYLMKQGLGQTYEIIKMRQAED